MTSPFDRIMDVLPLDGFRASPPLVAVVRLDGVIGRLGPLHRGLSLASLEPAIERAFTMKGVKAVALCINSPGGSPVQSSLIAGRIRALAEEKNLPVFAFCEDVAASGGYWLALAADRIYADAASVVGSIGVVSSSFGFTGLLKQLGIERRLHTAGENKARLDPFRPERPEDVEHLKQLQSDIHASFGDWARTRRGDRLKAPEKVAFSGDFWSGRKALEMGLIDGLGDLRSVMRAEFGEKVKLRPVGGRAPFWRRLFRQRGAAWADEAMALIEERLVRGRFGL